MNVAGWAETAIAPLLVVSSRAVNYSSMSYGRAVPIYKTKTFARFARGEKLTDASLIEAVERAERGLVDAYLGGDVIKQRVARQEQGKRGGFRTLIALRSGDCAVVMFGFAKNERDNIDDDELKALRLIGSQWLNDPREGRQGFGGRNLDQGEP